MIFVHTWACQSRAHCLACRTDPQWRAIVKAPDVCPHGVTADDLPELMPGAAERAVMPKPRRNAEPTPEEVDRLTTIRARCFGCLEGETCPTNHSKVGKCGQWSKLRKGLLTCPKGLF